MGAGPGLGVGGGALVGAGPGLGVGGGPGWPLGGLGDGAGSALMLSCKIRSQ